MKKCFGIIKKGLKPEMAGEDLTTLIERLGRTKKRILIELCKYPTGISDYPQQLVLVSILYDLTLGLGSIVTHLLIWAL